MRGPACSPNCFPAIKLQVGWRLQFRIDSSPRGTIQDSMITLKRRNFFALLFGSIAAFIFIRKPKSGPVYIDGKWIDYQGPFETQDDFDSAVSRGELIQN